MPKPSERVFELRKEIAQQRLATAKMEPGFGFICKVSGLADEDALRTIEYDHGTTLSAILAYLDEREVANV